MAKNKAGGKKRFVGVNFDTEVYEMLKARAEKEGRSISNMIAFFVSKGVHTQKCATR